MDPVQTAKRSRFEAFSNPSKPAVYDTPLVTVSKKPHNHTDHRSPSGKRIAVFTSGGDSQGMNAAVRAVIRTCLTMDIEPYAIFEGYQGMVDGGKYIRRMCWTDVSGILQAGGTILGTARCQAFREREGRKKAVCNLVAKGIASLVCIGGDGSLTGADILRSEWPELLKELVSEGSVSLEMASTCQQLRVVGMVGSIDNDMVGTEYTIGSVTAMDRITSALDSIATTASSHRRVFVVEVMGRNCGWLALMSAVVTGADWIFLPEKPVGKTWRDELCEMLDKGRQLGKRAGLILLAEGAKDVNGTHIAANDVRECVTERLHLDVRVTILGHMQRGGIPVAFDRYMSTILGVEAVKALANNEDDLLLGMDGYRVTKRPLMECVKKTQRVGELIAEGKYKEAIELRGPQFDCLMDAMQIVLKEEPPKVVPRKQLIVGILNSGASAPGMNAAVRVVTRMLLGQGHRVKAIKHGFDGMASNDVEEFTWASVSGWAPWGGAFLGTNRDMLSDKNIEEIVETIEQHEFDCILMIGGFEGYRSMITLQKATARFPSLKNLSLICIPATGSDRFHWVEFSPFEMGASVEGAFIPTWALGRPFCAGVQEKAAPELHLGRLMALFGSAYCAHFKRLSEEIGAVLDEKPELVNLMGKVSDSYSSVKQALTSLIEKQELTGESIIPPAKFHNALFQFDQSEAFQSLNKELAALVIEKSSDKFSWMLDAGVDFNLPFPPLLRNAREVDIIFALDASVDDRDQRPRSLLDAELWARQNGYNFPTIDYTNLKNIPFSVFGDVDDPKTPVVVYMPLADIDAKFDAVQNAKDGGFCSTFNFTMQPDDVETLSGMTQRNMEKNKDKIVDLISKIVMRDNNQ